MSIGWWGHWCLLKTPGVCNYAQLNSRQFLTVYIFLHYTEGAKRKVFCYVLFNGFFLVVLELHHFPDFFNAGNNHPLLLAILRMSCWIHCLSRPWRSCFLVHFTMNFAHQNSDFWKNSNVNSETKNDFFLFQKKKNWKIQPISRIEQSKLNL